MVTVSRNPFLGTVPRLLRGRTRIATRTFEVAPRIDSGYGVFERGAGVDGLDAILARVGFRQVVLLIVAGFVYLFRFRLVTGRNSFPWPMRKWVSGQSNLGSWEPAK